MNDRFESLESGEVISVQHDTLVLSGHRTFRVGELNEAIESHLKKAIDNWNNENNAWFTPQGLDCEALRFGSKGWQKGRIRLCLEFCPDESETAAHVTSASQPTTINSTAAPGASIASSMPTAHHDDRIDSPQQISAPTMSAADDQSNSHPIATNTSIASEPLAEPGVGLIPLAGMTAMGAATVAAATATATPSVADSAPMIPHFTDTTLELEEHPIDAGVLHNSPDEIAFDFGIADDCGIATPNGMMELDLTDLGLDFSENDLLSFEPQGITDGMDEFINLQDIGKSENSGMLIDEVWNELNQGNWTGSN
jgi:KGK domain